MTTSPTFIPQADELNTMVRDLRFRPATTTAPTALTPTQVDDFNRDGYLLPLPIYTPDEIGEIRAYFDALLDETLRAGRNSYSISTAHRTYGRVYDILTDSRIVRLVADLLGPDVVAWGSHFFCKMPGDGKRVAWHQDSSYWPLTPSHAVTVWLAIDDADTANGCMRYIPTSHHQGHLTYHLSEEDEANVLNQTVPNAEQFGTPVDVALKAGSASLHSDLLLHGSEANTSDRRRCGLTLRYCAADVRAGLGWNEKGVIVRGSDPTGHWSNQPRPDRE